MEIDIEAYRERAIEFLQPQISVKVNEVRNRNPYLCFSAAYGIAIKEFDTEIERVTNELIDIKFEL